MNTSEDGLMENTRKAAIRKPLDVATNEDKEQALSGLKVKVNELLYTTLPPQTSIRDMEKLAVKIHAMIEGEWF